MHFFFILQYLKKCPCCQKILLSNDNCPEVSNAICLGEFSFELAILQYQSQGKCFPNYSDLSETMKFNGFALATKLIGKVIKFQITDANFEILTFPYMKDARFPNWHI